jgi:glycosyltransferase involved in cell wall biosynthesis
LTRVLFISHEASRTGAPILLLRLVGIIKEQGEIDCEFLVKKDGPLLSEFKDLAPTRCYEHETWVGSALDIKARLRRTRNIARLKKYVSQFDVVFSNTMTNGDLDVILSQHPRVITYVHELQRVIELETNAKSLNAVLKHSKRFLYVSEAVRINLKQTHHIPEDKLFRLNGYVPDKYSLRSSLRAEVRSELGFTNDDIVVCGMGTNDWRKGTDLFVESAIGLCSESPNLRFIWVGSNSNSKEHHTLSDQIRKAGLDKRIMLLPPQNQAERYFAASDIFFLSSREDPFPLVMIEAAMMHLPIVYFNGTGGAEEFVSDLAGIGVGQLSVEQACKAILQLTESAEVRTSLANEGRKRYEKGHQKESVYHDFLEVSLVRK